MLKTSDGHLARVALCPPAWVPEAGIHRSITSRRRARRAGGGRTTLDDGSRFSRKCDNYFRSSRSFGNELDATARPSTN